MPANLRRAITRNHTHDQSANHRHKHRLPSQRIRSRIRKLRSSTDESKTDSSPMKISSSNTHANPAPAAPSNRRQSARSQHPAICRIISQRLPSASQPSSSLSSSFSPSRAWPSTNKFLQCAHQLRPISALQSPVKMLRRPTASALPRHRACNLHQRPPMIALIRHPPHQPRLSARSTSSTALLCRTIIRSARYEIDRRSPLRHRRNHLQQLVLLRRNPQLLRRISLKLRNRRKLIAKLSQAPLNFAGALPTRLFLFFDSQHIS